MVWVSFPSELLVPRLQNTLHGQAFVLQGSDCTWGSNGFLFSFSPRSALLMLLFGLSIRRRQGLPDFVHTAMVTTLGMRLSWGRWKELLQNANVWNRRYVDFFVAMAGTLTLSRQQDAGALQSMVTLVVPSHLMSVLIQHFAAESQQWLLSTFSYSHTGALLEHGVECTMVGPGPTGSASALCAPRL